MKGNIYKTDDGLFYLDEPCRKRIADEGYNLIDVPCKSVDDLIANCRDAVGLIVTVEPVTAKVIDSLPKLVAVARCGVGVDTVDLIAATERCVQVTNVPDANIEEVAVHTIGMILSLTRRIEKLDRRVRQGGWESRDICNGIRRPKFQSLGIVGFGKIGEKVCTMASAIGFQVLAATLLDAEKERARSLGAIPVTFEELIREADIVTLHVPLTKETRNILSGDVMCQMKRGSYIVNVSRGGLVDETALVKNLDSGHLAGAALDVFATEPLEVGSQLLTAKNLILTPHVAYYSGDSSAEVARKLTDEILAVLRGGAPKYPVNSLQRI